MVDVTSVMKFTNLLAVSLLCPSSILLAAETATSAPIAACTPTDANYLRIHFMAEGYPVANIDTLVNKHCEDLEAKLRSAQFIKDLGNLCTTKSTAVATDYYTQLTKILAKEDPIKTEEYAAFTNDARSFNGALSEAIGKDVLTPLMQAMKEWSDAKGLSRPETPLNNYLDNVFAATRNGETITSETLVTLIIWLDSLQIALEKGVVDTRNHANTLWGQVREGRADVSQHEALIYEETHKKLYKWIQCIHRVKRDIEEKDFQTAGFFLDTLQSIIA